jgi:hypothetical protein
MLGTYLEDLRPEAEDVVDEDDDGRSIIGTGDPVNLSTTKVVQNMRKRCFQPTCLQTVDLNELALLRVVG